MPFDRKKYDREHTTLVVRISTKEKLYPLKRMRETWDEFLIRLAEGYRED